MVQSPTPDHPIALVSRPVGKWLNPKNESTVEGNHSRTEQSSYNRMPKLSGGWKKAFHGVALWHNSISVNIQGHGKMALGTAKWLLGTAK